MQDYKPNSNRFKQEQKEAAVEREKLAPVVQGARAKEESELVKAARSAKSHAWSEVLMPMFKDLLWKLITDTADILIFRNDSRRTTTSTTPYVSYSSVSKAPSTSRASEPQTQKKLDYRDLVFSTYADADRVLKMMQDIIDQYEVVRVADIYDIAGVSADFGSHTDTNYGWTDIHTASIDKIRDANGFGYILKLPRALPIER